MMLPAALVSKLTPGTLVVYGSNRVLRDGCIIDWVEDGENPVTLEDTPEFHYTDDNHVYVIMKFYWEEDRSDAADEMLEAIRNQFGDYDSYIFIDQP